MICPKCQSNNVTVQLVETGQKGKTTKTSLGVGGHAYNATRGLMAISTLGMSNLFMKKTKGKEHSKIKTKNETYCICQECGNTWKVK